MTDVERAARRLLASTLHHWIATEAQCGRKLLDVSDREAQAAYWRSFEQERTPFDAWTAKQVRARFRAELKEFRRRSDNGWGIEEAALDAIHPNDWNQTLTAAWTRIGRHFGSRAWNALQPPKRSFISLFPDARNGGPHEHKASPVDPWWAEFEAYIERWTAEKVVLITSTTRDAIRREIRSAVNAGEGVYEAKRRIEKLYLDEIIPHRAEVIARTEVMSASNASTRASTKAYGALMGLTMQKRWLATQDDRTRDWHRDANGQLRDMDEPYLVHGEQLMFPGDGSMGATGSNIIQCRCVETYSVKK